VVHSVQVKLGQLFSFLNPGLREQMCRAQQLALADCARGSAHLARHWAAFYEQDGIRNDT